jgi:hypothetical protein
MYYRISPSQEQFLLSQPETGMGYQVVEAKRRGSELHAKFFVLNSELAIEMNEAAPLYVKQIANQGIESVLEKAMNFQWEIKKVIHADPELKPIAVAETVKEEFPDGAEIFVRRSIYANDKRIDQQNKSLRPGTFTTTLADSLRHRHSSDDPLIQLAMDHGVRGKWGYHVCPKRTDRLHRGKMDPHTGAKEIFFKSGTAPGTFLKRETY